MKNSAKPYAELLNPDSAQSMDKYNERYHALCKTTAVTCDEVTEWVTRDQAREYMGVFPHTLATLIYRGRIRVSPVDEKYVNVDDVIVYVMKKMAEL